MKIRVFRVLRIQNDYIREDLGCLDTNKIEDLYELMCEVQHEREIEIYEVKE